MRERIGRRYQWSATPATTERAVTASAVTTAFTSPNRRKGKAPPSSSSSSSSSSDDEPTEEERVYWEKAEEILREYNLSKMAMVSSTHWEEQTTIPALMPSCCIVCSRRAPRGYGSKRWDTL